MKQERQNWQREGSCCKWGVLGWQEVAVATKEVVKCPNTHADGAAQLSEPKGVIPGSQTEHNEIIEQNYS